MNYFHIIRKRLITLGVSPTDSRQIAIWFQRQVVNRGTTGALNLFKAVGDTLIGYISKSGYKADWVKVTQGGYPSSLLLLKDYPLEVQLRVSKVARAILLKDPSADMVEKLRKAATGPRKGTDEAYQRLSLLVKKGMEFQHFPQYTYYDKYTTAFKSIRTYTNRSVPTGTEVGLDMEKLFSTFRSWGSYLTDLPNWPDLMYPLHPSYVGRNLLNYGTHEHVGELGGVMEQGGKLRIFAAPSVLLNNALEPLQIWLDKYRSFTEWDCYKNQAVGMQWAQDKLKEGTRVHSIDLSSATCRFPFEVQLELCKLLGAPNHSISLYEAVARGSYKVQPHLEALFGTEITWTVGQPLGVNPSMSSFALCHGLFLVGLCLELDIDPNDSFRILGDDVVTSNDSLAHAYRQEISSLGISISEHKSYVSNNYAEFAGYCITRDLAVRPGRWKKPSQLNIVGLISDLGALVTNELVDDPTPALLLAFRNGDYNPSSEEWNTWLKLNSLAYPGVGEKYRTFSRSSTWFEGCVKFLTKELHQRPPYFDSEMQDLFIETVPESPVKELVSQLVRFGIEFQTTENIMALLESFASDILPYQEYAAYCVQINELYEAYTWSKPQTKGRKVRDELVSLKAILAAL